MAENRESWNRVIFFLLLTAAISSIFYCLIIHTGRLGAGRGLYVTGADVEPRRGGPHHALQVREIPQESRLGMGHYQNPTGQLFDSDRLRRGRLHRGLGDRIGWLLQRVISEQ